MNRYVAIDKIKVKDGDYVYTLATYNGTIINLTRAELTNKLYNGLIEVRNLKVDYHGNIKLLKYTPFKISRLDNCKREDTGKTIYKQIMMLTKFYFKPLENLPGAECKVFNLGYSLDTPLANEVYEVKFAIIHNEMLNIVTLSAVLNEHKQIIFEARHNILNRATGEKKLNFNMLYDANTDMYRLISDILLSLNINSNVLYFY